MADIAASDITYSVQREGLAAGNQEKENVVDITFGDGVLTYPSGGVVIAKGSLGCPNDLSGLLFLEPHAANGFLYKFDESAVAIRIYQGDNDNASDAPLIELVAATATPAAATLRVKVTGH